ncbi:unnamed protein product, partial [Amoebophrya sp. A120]
KFYGFLDAWPQRNDVDLSLNLSRTRQDERSHSCAAGADRNCHERERRYYKSRRERQCSGPMVEGN